MKAEKLPSAEASAPGRLDIMGGIADYSGSLVLPMPIARKTTVAITLRDDYQCTLKSQTNAGNLSASLDWKSFLNGGEIDYDHARRQFAKAGDQSWTAYVLGCVLVLEKEKKIGFRGADFQIRSDIPIGKGVSSSAALEVATLKALRTLFGLTFEGTELPRLAQQAENKIAGAACGLMDQLTAFFGQAGRLLPIVCQPDLVMKPLAIPGSVSFVGIDSGIRHAVGGSSYTEVRCAAFMGYSIILEALGIDWATVVRAKEKKDISGLPYDGYLCNIPVAEFEKKFKALLPSSISGKEFNNRFAGIVDRETAVDETTIYRVLECTAHPVYENERVRRFRDLLQQLHGTGPADETHLSSMGALMFEAHESYSRCGLGSERTDALVALAKEYRNVGIFGAKITGGGNGGTVCFLAHAQGRDAVRDLHRRAEEEFGEGLALFET